MGQPTPTSTLDNPSHSMLHGSHFNVKAYGAVGDGVTDDTAEIQDAIDDALLVGGQVFFPNGVYLVTGALTITNSIRLSGVMADAGNLGSRITGSVSTAIINKTSGTDDQVIIEYLSLQNLHATGKTIYLAGCISPTGIYHCSIGGHKAIDFGDSVFSVSITDCRLGGTGETGSRGIFFHGHCNIINCDVVGFEYGIYVDQGFGINIVGGRFEVNTYGIYATGISTGTITGQTFEGNDYAITLHSVAGMSVNNQSFYGTAAAPSGGSIVAVDVINCTNSLVSGIVERGTHSTGFVRVSAVGTHTNLTFLSCYTDSSAWVLGSKTGVQIINCNLVDDIVRLPVIATASLPAAGAQEDERVVIEDGGTGNRNLILYAGGERFRIDGGANV